MQHCQISSCLIHCDKTLQYKVCNITIIMPSILTLQKHNERTDDVSCLREQGAQRYANNLTGREDSLS